MSEDTGFLPGSLHEASLHLSSPCSSTSAQNGEPRSVFALMFVCVLLWQTWHLKVVAGGDYWLASPNLFWVSAVTAPFATKWGKESEAGQRGMSDQSRSVEAWPVEPRLKVFWSLKFISVSRAEADTCFCCTWLCTYSSSGMQKQRHSHALQANTEHIWILEEVHLAAACWLSDGILFQTGFANCEAQPGQFQAG